MQYYHNYSKQPDSTRAFSASATMMGALPLPYLYINATGLVLYANKHLVQLSGYSLPEIFESSVDDLFALPIGDWLFVLSQWAETQPQGIVIGFKDKNGQTLSTRIKIITEAKGHCGSAAFHILIIQVLDAYEADTHLKLLEEDYDVLKQHLKSQINFIHKCLNQLKDPVSILSTSHYLLKNSSGASRENYINQIEGQIVQLKNLIHAATDYLQADTIDNQIKGKVFSLNQVVQEVLTIYHHQFEARGIEVKLRLPMRDFLVIGDRKRLVKAFLNIFANANQYTQEGAVHVSIQADYDLSLVFVLIQDTGIGIPQTEIKHVFEQFYRAENARRERPNRSGLGLCVSKDIIEQHNGEIAIYSREQVGTSVVVTLPCVI